MIDNDKTVTNWIFNNDKAIKIINQIENDKIIQMKANCQVDNFKTIANWIDNDKTKTNAYYGIKLCMKSNNLFATSEPPKYSNSPNVCFDSF